MVVPKLSGRDHGSGHHRGARARGVGVNDHLPRGASIGSVVAHGALALGGSDAVVGIEARDVVEVELTVRVEHFREGLSSVGRLKDAPDVPVAYMNQVDGVERW